MLRLIGSLAQWLLSHRAAADLSREITTTANALDAVTALYRRGDYAAALGGAEGFSLGGEVSGNYCFYRGSCLAQLGRLAEAELWFRRNIAIWEENEPDLLSTAYTSLGHVLLQAGRYDEAVECFETSIRLHPDFSAAYRHMAEAILMRGDNASDAIRYARLSIEKANANQAISEEVRGRNTGQACATLAWAVATASRDAAEVKRLAGEALAGVGTSSLQTSAEVHYQLGCGYRELGDTVNSAQHYNAAAALDPQGESGRAARAALAGKAAAHG